MCVVTTTELRKNLKHYLELSAKEDVYVRRNGEIFAYISSSSKRDPLQDFFDFADSLPKFEGDSQAAKDLVGDMIMEKCGF